MYSRGSCLSTFDFTFPSAGSEIHEQNLALRGLWIHKQWMDHNQTYLNVLISGRQGLDKCYWVALCNRFIHLYTYYCSHKSPLTSMALLPQEMGKLHLIWPGFRHKKLKNYPSWALPPILQQFSYLQTQLLEVHQNIGGRCLLQPTCLSHPLVNVLLVKVLTFVWDIRTVRLNQTFEEYK